MKLTNKYNLPQPFLNLFNKERYSKGAARVSVTELIGSPRISILREQHYHEVEEDITDKFWALMGTNIHRILEQGADAEHIAEERLFVEIDNWIISGAIDLQRYSEGGVGIIDWKFVSVASVQSPKPEWTKQLNCYKWLMKEVKGVDVERLQVCAILRDWSKARSTTDRLYPQAPVAMVDLEVWPHEKTDTYLRSRLAAHKEGRRAHLWGEEIPQCQPEDTWERPATFAAVKSAGGRASRVFDNRLEAEDYVRDKPALSVEVRPGDRVRCSGNYCGVARFCSQYNGTLHAL